jgi:hypothetical protein
MQYGIEYAKNNGRKIEFRSLTKLEDREELRNEFIYMYDDKTILRIILYTFGYLIYVYDKNMLFSNRTFVKKTLYIIKHSYAKNYNKVYSVKEDGFEKHLNRESGNKFTNDIFFYCREKVSEYYRNSGTTFKILDD